MTSAVINTNTVNGVIRNTESKPDLVCFSHLRWNFVYQRPQHLLSRFAHERRVFFVDEPVFGSGSMRLECSEAKHNVYVVVPHLPDGLKSEVATHAILREMTGRLMRERGIRDDFIAWYYTPMALEFTDHLNPSVVIYDCMDELSAFKGAPARLKECERDLLRRADLVFTGGHSLYEAKKHQHHAIHPFPSSV